MSFQVKNNNVNASCTTTSGNYRYYDNLNTGAWGNDRNPSLPHVFEGMYPQYLFCEL